MSSALGAEAGGAKLLPYQRAWLDDESQLKIWLASRQVGKSFTLALEAVRECMRARCNAMILSSSERQSREVMHKVISYLGYFDAYSGGVLGADGEGVTEARLGNGSRIISLPSNPDTVRGFSGHVFLDEFAFHGDAREIWRAMYPTVTRGYKVRVSSTPNGRRGMFYELWERGEGLSRHRVTIHDAVAAGLDADVRRLRAGIGDGDAWEQEYECGFLDAESSFIAYELIAACESGEAGLGIGEPHGDLYVGVDIGRRRDMTVAWVLEDVGGVYWTRAVKELRDAPFQRQREEIGWILDGASGGCVDATGIGAQLAEEFSMRYGARIREVTFTAPVKEEMAVALKRALEEGRVRVPASREVREDLHSVSRVVTGAGNVTYGAGREGGSHADRFWALALAVRAAEHGRTQLMQYESLGTRRPGFANKGCL